jgi:hypothetical protein
VGKTLWGVCVLSEEDQGRADPLICMLANTADYLKMGFRSSMDCGDAFCVDLANAATNRLALDDINFEGGHCLMTCSFPEEELFGPDR